ncbi:MAG: GNAT family N-acetyltransferase [Myxococcales bacterium]|nr:GNAT family N-acetyltransferase [Myxococcales bacterium]
MTRAADDAEVDPDTGLPIGRRLTDPSPARRPERRTLEGRYARLEPLEPGHHAAGLFAAATAPGAAARHRYLFAEVPTDPARHRATLDQLAASTDPLAFAVIDRATARVEGQQSFLRITPEHRTIEIGSIVWGPAIARTRVATEANYLFARYAFDALGYRRYEWKCDALNAPSRRAATRFGFRFEGLFRHHMIVKGRARDTAWYAMTIDDWPRLRAAYEAWLDPANFDAAGAQRARLAAALDASA